MDHKFANVRMWPVPDGYLLLDENIRVNISEMFVKAGDFWKPWDGTVSATSDRPSCTPADAHRVIKTSSVTSLSTSYADLINIAGSKTSLARIEVINAAIPPYDQKIYIRQGTDIIADGFYAIATFTGAEKGHTHREAPIQIKAGASITSCVVHAIYYESVR